MTNSVNQNYKSFVARKFSWLLLGRVLPVLVLFLITIIYSRKLSYDDYGKFQSVWMYVNIINVVISFGISTVILSTNLNFLFSFIRNNKKKLSVFFSILWISVLIIFFLFAKNFNVSLKFLLIAFIIIQNISTVAETLLIKQQGEKISFVINMIYSFLFFGWHLYLLFNNYSLYYLISGICGLSVLKLLAMILIPGKKESYEEVIDEKYFLKHWAYLGSNDVLGIVSKWIDKLFLLYLLTATDFAIFFNGSFEIPLFSLLISVTGSFLLIEISGNAKFTGKVSELFRESFNMLSSIVFPLFFFLFFFCDELFSFAFKDKYNASLPIFLISIFIIPLRINNYSVILQSFGQGKKIMWGSALDIFIAILLMLILYPIAGTRGIALAGVIATYCQVLYYLWHSAKILNTSIFQILPLQKLAIKFLIILALYVGLFFILKGTEIKIKLLIATIFTVIIVLTGLMKYSINFLKDAHF
ncbi:MAG: polysaccharide biosynthesis C-terminal domain-containing protein [Bacteroidota bacterium]|nr:polysaccharide biosynthesis C-terminal domain-containing protein [Bacteroidota bacterium]